VVERADALLAVENLPVLGPDLVVQIEGLLLLLVDDFAQIEELALARELTVADGGFGLAELGLEAPILLLEVADARHVAGVVNVRLLFLGQLGYRVQAEIQHLGHRGVARRHRRLLGQRLRVGGRVELGRLGCALVGQPGAGVHVGELGSQGGRAVHPSWRFLVLAAPAGHVRLEQHVAGPDLLLVPQAQRGEGGVGLGVDVGVDQHGRRRDPGLAVLEVVERLGIGLDGAVRGQEIQGRARLTVGVDLDLLDIDHLDVLLGHPQLEVVVVLLVNHLAQADELVDLVDQLLVGEAALVNVLVGVDAQLAMAVKTRLGHRLRREHDRDLAGYAFLGLVAERVPGLVGQLDGDEDDLGPQVGHAAQRVRVLTDDVDLETVRAEILLQPGLELRIAIDQQDRSGAHLGGKSFPSCAAPV
jgi:hypothetical protein